MLRAVPTARAAVGRPVGHRCVGSPWDEVAARFGRDPVRPDREGRSTVRQEAHLRTRRRTARWPGRRPSKRGRRSRTSGVRHPRSRPRKNGYCSTGWITSQTCDLKTVPCPVAGSHEYGSTFPQRGQATTHPRASRQRCGSVRTMGTYPAGSQPRRSRNRRPRCRSTDQDDSLDAGLQPRKYLPYMQAEAVVAHES